MTNADLIWVILGIWGYSFLGDSSLDKLNVLTLDVETTHKEKLGGGTTALPYFNNRLVSVGWKWLLNENVNYKFIYHKDAPIIDGSQYTRIQSDLNKADVLVGQNKV